MKEYWLEIASATLVLAEIIARITPTKKDNTIVGFLKRVLDFIIANKRKDGGVHK